MTRKQKVRLISAWTLGKADPEAVYAELESLRKTGGLTVRRVLEVAEDPANPLHPMFEWDDAQAAALFREEQARRVLRSITVQVNDEPPRRVYAHVPAARGEGFYERQEIVVQHVDMFALALNEALSDVRAAQERVGELRRLSEGKEDRIAVIAIASQALATAQEAVQRLH